MSKQAVVGETVVLTISHAPPPGLNAQERMHWAKRRELRRLWAEFAWAEWYKAGRPRFWRPEVEVRLYYKTHRTRDWANAAAAVKPILDGLKGFAFEDDDTEHIRLVLSIEVDANKPRVEIVLRERGEPCV